jgi:hypothetical protein
VSKRRCLCPSVIGLGLSPKFMLRGTRICAPPMLISGLGQPFDRTWVARVSSNFLAMTRLSDSGKDHCLTIEQQLYRSPWSAAHRIPERVRTVAPTTPCQQGRLPSNWQPRSLILLNDVRRNYATKARFVLCLRVTRGTHFPLWCFPFRK